MFSLPTPFSFNLFYTLPTAFLAKHQERTKERKKKKRIIPPNKGNVSDRDIAKKKDISFNSSTPSLSPPRNSGRKGTYYYFHEQQALMKIGCSSRTFAISFAIINHKTNISIVIFVIMC